jgi:signal transduction histidine kinase
MTAGRKVDAALLIDSAAKKPDSMELVDAGKAVREAISKVRDLSSLLSPPLLKDIGLEEAIKALVHQHERATKMKVVVDIVNILEMIPESKLLAIYRIVQEALTNVARHSKASEVKVGLFYQDGFIILLVNDNGSGFDINSTVKSTGLIGMRERAVSLGGELTIESSCGHGTKIVGKIPFLKMEQAVKA